MDKKIILTGAMVLSITALTACGDKKDNQLYNSLEQQVKHNVSYVDKEQIDVNLNLQAAVTGNEKENVVKLVYSANIMNKPSKESVVVGSVNAKESVLVIGNENIDGWYKVAYNGRVCYVEASKLDLDTLVVDNGDNNVNNGQENRPTTTATPQRPVSTSSTTSASNGTTTGNRTTSSNSTTSNKNTTSGTTTSNRNTTTGKENNSDQTTSIRVTIERPETTSREEQTTTRPAGTTTGNGGSENITPEETTSSNSGNENTTPEVEKPSEEVTTPEEQTTLPRPSVEEPTETTTERRPEETREEHTTRGPWVEPHA